MKALNLKQKHEQNIIDEASIVMPIRGEYKGLLFFNDEEFREETGELYLLGYALRSEEKIPSPVELKALDCVNVPKFLIENELSESRVAIPKSPLR